MPGTTVPDEDRVELDLLLRGETVPSGGDHYLMVRVLHTPSPVSIVEAVPAEAAPRGSSTG